MKDPRTLLNKQTTQNTQNNTTKSTGMKDPRTLVNVQTPQVTVQKPTNNAFNILNNATKAQSYNDVGTPEAILNNTGITQPNRQTYNASNTNLLRKEIENKVNEAQTKKKEEENKKKKSNPFSFMSDEIMAEFEGTEYDVGEEAESPTLLREHIAGTASLGLTDVYQEQNKKNKDVTAKVYDEYLEKLRANEKEYIEKLGQENYNKLFEEIYNNSNQKPIDRDFFTQLRLNLGGGNVQGVTNIVNTGAMLLNDELGQKASESTQWARDLNNQVLQGNQNRGFGTQFLNASNTVGNMIPTIAATSVNPALGKVALFGNAAGGAYNEALDNGASLGQAKANAILSGGTELAIESLSGGISNKLLGSKALFNPSNLTKNIRNKFVKGGIDFGLEVLGEGLEEVATTALQPVIDRITYNPNATTSGEELWASFRDSILPTLLLQGLGTATSGINNYSENQIKQIQNSNLTQEQKTDLINKTIEQRDKLLNEVQNAEQPTQTVAPQSPNTQVQQQTNEVIPQQAENQNNANVVQNNTQIAQNTPNNVQISQNNVQNAQDLQKTGQNDVNPYNGYTNKEIENFEGGKIKVAKSDNDIINFVQTAKKVANNLKLYMSKVKKTTSDIIKTKYNINVEGYNISLKNDDVRKVYKDHGTEETEAPRGQVPITEEDFALIPTIINEADNIELGGTSPQGKPAIRFEKNINGNRVVVTYVSDKHKNLELQTMYKFKNDKKIDSSTALYEKTPRLNTSEMDSSTNLINNIIPNSQNYVNNQNIMPSLEQLQARDLKQGEEISNTLNMKKPKLEDIANLTEKEAELPMLQYKGKTDKGSPYKSKFLGNIKSSKIISQQIKDTIEVKSYERKANADVLKKMQDKLSENPMKTVTEWLNKKKNFTEQDVALGAILMQEYQSQGRFEEAVDVTEKLLDMAPEVGRAVQMYSIFQRLTPEGMMIYQQRKLNNALETLTAKQTGKWVEQNKDKFKLTEDDATFITAKVQEAQNAPTERQKQIALAEIESRINDKLPPEAGQSVKAYRRIAMLFNPKTQVRNVVGNITVMPLNYVTDLVGTAIDKAVAKKTGIRTTTLPNVKTIGKGFVKGASETIDDYRRGIRTTPTGSRYEIQNNAKSFNENTDSRVKNAINNKLNAIDRILSTTLELGDRPFYEAAYQNALEGQMKANNVTEPTQEMIDIASNVALSQTWQDNNNYTQAVLGIRNAFNKINIKGFGLGDLIIPFAKTPANLTKAMVDYSPAGLISSVINYNDMRKAISRGDMTPMQQKKFVTSVGKAVAGTMLYAIAGALVQGGAVTGSSDEDKDVANFEKNVLGIQPYSIKIGDKTFTYNWAQPLATPFAIMADTKKMTEEGAEWNEILVNAFKVAGDQLVANSFLQGIQELLSSEYGNESAMDNLISAIMDLPTQFTPTLLGQIATQFDATKRQTFENGDTVGTMVNEVKNKIPGVKNTLAPQVNTFGEEIQNYGGDNNPFNVFLNPGNISSANATDTQKELYALYEVTQDKTIFPRQAPYSVSGSGEKIQLSSQDRAKYQKTSGQYVTDNLGALFDSEFYKSLENDKKVEVINKIVSDADTTAKDIWIDTKTTEDLEELKNDLKEANIPLIDYYNAWIAQKDVEGEKNQFTGKTKTGTKKQARIKAIDEAVRDNLNTWQVNKLYDILN